MSQSGEMNSVRSNIATAMRTYWAGSKIRMLTIPGGRRLCGYGCSMVHGNCRDVSLHGVTSQDEAWRVGGDGKPGRNIIAAAE
jgi:hypothetical protein